MTKIAFLRGTSTGSALLTPLDGEPIWETDTEILKIGNSGGNLIDVCMTDAAQTLSNKTLVEPQLASPARILDPNGNVAMLFVAAASAVNYIAFNNSAAGSAAAVAVLGADASIDILLRPKGQGRVCTGVGTSYWPINDAATTNPTDSFDGNPLVDGQRYYNTTDHEWYYYDSGRSKWFSDFVIPFHFGHASDLAPGARIRTVGADATADAVYTMPFTGTVVGYSYHRSDSDATTFEIQKNGAQLFDIPSSAQDGYNFSTVDFDVAAGDTLGAIVDAGAANNAFIKTLVIYVRRRRA